MKILGKMFKVLKDTLAKMSQNIFAYFSDHSASFYLFHLFGYGQGVAPPPFTGEGATYRFFFDAFPK